LYSRLLRGNKSVGRATMSKHSSRFVANRELWGALREHVRKTKGVRAAIAYFGRNGATLFPLKRGDTIVADVSLGAVRQGVTDPRALRTLMQRGVAIFSRERLHAKFIIANRTLIASSANVSRNSRDVPLWPAVRSSNLGSIPPR
jgi:hypothetical protein